MKSIKISIFLFLIAGSIIAQDINVSALTIEYKTNPLGIDASQPRFSWKIAGKGNDIMQTAYSLRVASDQKFSSGKIVFESGKMTSAESVLLPYNGPALKSG